MIDDTVASLMAIGFTALLLSALTSVGWLNAPIDLRSDAAQTRNWVQSNLNPNGVGSATLDITVAPPKLPNAPAPTQPEGTVQPQVAPMSNPVAVRSAKLGLQHPLLDMIYSPARQESVPAQVLARELGNADIILVGETHDNPDHHNLQAWIIREMVRKGRKPAVAFEMIGADQQPQLAAYVSKLGATPEGLGEALGWNRHWPDWSIYVPIAREAFANGLPILPADADADRIDRVSRDGLRALVDAERRRLGLAADLPAEHAADMLNEIKQAHCNLLPANEIEPMSQVQRFRDATMADNLLTAATKHPGGVVLIAGSGRIRSDRGIPYYLRQRGPQLRVVTVQLVEVDDAIRDPAQLVPRDAAGRPAADYVWYTARAERPDPCVEMRNALNRRNSGG